jgi:hypothetical protein
MTPPVQISTQGRIAACGFSRKVGAEQRLRRIGLRGQMMVETHPDEGKAITALMKLAAVKKRRGYVD